MNQALITLINCDEKILNLILKGDEDLSKELGLIVPAGWSEFGQSIFEFILAKIKEEPTAVKWYSYLPLETKTRTLLGSCGYKGGPDENGIVEIGYEVAKDYRNLGYATKIVELLINMAFEDNRVKKIRAHTLANKNASVRVLEKCNFKFIEEFEDEEDGKVWKWMKDKG